MIDCARSVAVVVPSPATSFVLEAASFGVPSIVSSIYALPEIVLDKKTGLVIKPGSITELKNSLEKLIKNKYIRTKMGKQAQKRFESEFSISKTNILLKKIYLEYLPQ